MFSTCLFRRRSQSGPSAAERYRAGGLQRASVEVKGLKVFLDHALNHDSLIVFAKGRALAPVAYLGFSDFRQGCAIDRVDLQQTKIIECRVILRSV